MFLTNEDSLQLRTFRHDLHRNPEISGEERETARRVVAALERIGPDAVVTDLGGHGVAAIFNGAEPGPVVMIRAELDGLPIEELSDIAHRSTISGKGHLCGHDGHMTILMGLARALGRQRPARGRAILLFQPAEETGAGAAAVIADPKFADLTPDFIFSLHNLPGMPLGHVALRAGPVNCASRGIKIALTGKTAHASSPEHGTSPAPAAAKLIEKLPAMGSNTTGSLGPDFVLVTVTHAKLGEPAFGIAPGYAEVWATLRTLVDDRMADLVARAEALATELATAEGLQLTITYHDVFHHCENASEAVELLQAALDAEYITHDTGEIILPMKGSEDFGLFGGVGKSAMFFLGSGENHPNLHNPDYDFPDDLIEIGGRAFLRSIRNLLG